MKKKIHPPYFEEAKVVCSCGNQFVVGSTQNNLRVEVCSSCHPFFTGESRYIDTQGRIEHFQRKVKRAHRLSSLSKKKSKKK